jgi:hypothetical protein
MPRKSKTAVEEGYLRSLWEEIAEIEREYNGVVTVTFFATNQRGVFSVEASCILMGVMKGGLPARHSITQRLPSGGPLPFAGALWDISRRLNDMVTEDAKARLGEHK